jgi:hypothetical protein
MWQRDQAVSTIVRSGRFWIEFNLARVNLTHMLGTPKGCSEATVCLSFRLVDQGHHKRLQNHTRFQSAGRTSVARLQNPYSWLPSNTYSYTSNQVTKRSKYMWWGVCPLLGRLATRLTAYHILQHVASTFKCLTTATTHCDLIHFNNTDGVSSQTWYSLKFPSVILIVNIEK